MYFYTKCGSHFYDLLRFSEMVIRFFSLFFRYFFLSCFWLFFSIVLTLSFLFCSLLLCFFLLYFILLILLISPIKSPPINQNNSVTIKLITSMETVDTVKISENWKCIPLKFLLQNVILYNSGFVVKYTRSCLSRAMSVILYHETITKQEITCKKIPLKSLLNLAYVWSRELQTKGRNIFGYQANNVLKQWFLLLIYTKEQKRNISNVVNF